MNNIETNSYESEPSVEKNIDHVLYHVAGFEPNPDDEIIELHPGTQNATGQGIYFTESFPQVKFAGGEKNQSRWNLPHVNIFKVALDHEESKNWFRAKNKPMRPRFWHSKNKTIRFNNRYEEQEIAGQMCHIYSDVIDDNIEQ